MRNSKLANGESLLWMRPCCVPIVVPPAYSAPAVTTKNTERTGNISGALAECKADRFPESFGRSEPSRRDVRKANPHGSLNKGAVLTPSPQKDHPSGLVEPDKMTGEPTQEEIQLLEQLRSRREPR